MSKMEYETFKDSIVKYFKSHGMPANVRTGVNSDIAEWFGQLMDAKAKETNLINKA